MFLLKSYLPPECDRYEKWSAVPLPDEDQHEEEEPDDNAHQQDIEEDETHGEEYDSNDLKLGDEIIKWNAIIIK